MLQVGGSLTAFRFVELRGRYGKILEQMCASFKDAEEEISERVLCIEQHWNRTAIQLEFLRPVWSEMGENHQRLQDQMLQKLYNKLTMTISRLQKVTRTESNSQTSGEPVMKIRKGKYLLSKSDLDESIADLASWQNYFDPTWFLILKISNHVIDDAIGRNRSDIFTRTSATKVRDALKPDSHPTSKIFLPKEDLKEAETYPISFSTAKRMRRLNSDKWFVVDPITCDSSVDVGLMTRDVRDLATKLQSFQPSTFGILQCHGVVRISEPGSRRALLLDFIFRIPDGVHEEPNSLRKYFFSVHNFSLTTRFEVAKQVVRSISYVHTLGFVHKNFRPETILGFRLSHDVDRSVFFLIGFENIRTVDGRTLRSGDSAWEKNLYRHPQRQGLHPEDIYTMQHDIYSLGVCLLEIGLWQSFLSYAEDTDSPVPSEALGLHPEAPEFRQPNLMKEHLVDLSKRTLHRRMGERYRDIVINCLTCLDKDNVDFGDPSEFEDQDGILVGVKYIEKVSSPCRCTVKSSLTLAKDTAEIRRNLGMRFSRCSMGVSENSRINMEPLACGPGRVASLAVRSM